MFVLVTLFLNRKNVISIGPLTALFAMHATLLNLLLSTTCLSTSLESSKSQMQEMVPQGP